MTGLRGWRPLLRLAWRDAARAKARSLLVVVLIALPVAGVVAADVSIQTARLSGTEGIERRLGAADARVDFASAGNRVYQTFDPDQGSDAFDDGADPVPMTPASVARILGRPVRGVSLETGGVDVRTDRGVVTAQLTQVAATDPLARGLFRLTAGRLPAEPGEVAVNGALAERGFGVGDSLPTAAGEALIVGIAEDGSRRMPLVVTTPETFDIPETPPTMWLIDAGPVSWSDVGTLNAHGITVLSRAVLADPPPDSELAPPVREFTRGVAASMLPVVVLIVVMALLEVVLLAGPAFAVTARRQSRALALVAACGGTPAQARRVVLGAGLVLGAAASGAGAILGIAAAGAARPVTQRFADSWLGPFDVRWSHVAVVVFFGMLSALLAAVVPAWVASRQNVVAVLAGRRGDGVPSRRSPVAGLALIAVAVGLAAFGSRQTGVSGATTIAGAAVVAVLGMILVVPVIVAATARVAGRLPLGPRFAARDAARHRTRTVPAVAAVAATVAGLVALGIAQASDEARSRATYEPQLAVGWGSVDAGRASDLAPLADAVRQESPATVIRTVRGFGGEGRERLVLRERTATGSLRVGTWATEAFGAPYLVADPGLIEALPGLDEATRAQAGETLDAGGALVFDVRGHRGEVTLTVRRGGEARATATVPALFVALGGPAPATALLAEQVVTDLGLTPRESGLVLDARNADDAGLERATERLRGLASAASLQVERGYRLDPAVRIVYLVLGAIGAVLVLGGTLTTTLLALSDARPDLATLAAVGAAPRTRRLVAASYAGIVGAVGAVLGAVVGAIPGIAIARPLTGTGAVYSTEGEAVHYLAIPWPLVAALVLGLPLVTALVMGLATRSRLPLVARLD